MATNVVLRHDTERRLLMALARWDPMRDMMAMREQMNRLVNEAFGRGGGEEGGWMTGAWMPPVEIYDTDDALMVRVELPGVAKEDVHVELHENTLSLRGERKPEPSIKEGQYYRQERTYGPFQRTFRLPTLVETAKVQATYRDGLLELRLPKSEAAKSKRIAISG
jgi:HSP20 family protein